jgi:hypothetical protein
MNDITIATATMTNEMKDMSHMINTRQGMAAATGTTTKIKEIGENTTESNHQATLMPKTIMKITDATPNKPTIHANAP